MSIRTVFVFLLSMIFCLLMLMAQRAIGIEWDFHPDAITYTTTFNEMTSALFEQGFFSFFNNFYYVVAWFLRGDILALISLNVVVYALTNVVIAKYFDFFAKRRSIKGGLYFFLLMLLLFIPYRLHLAVHILKDTLIIFFFVMIVAKYGSSYISWIGMLLLRVFSLLYVGIFLPRKWIIAGLVLLGLVVFASQDVVQFLMERNEIEMTFREFDSVPTFSDLGAVGILLRAVIWPFLVLSGAFFVLSPSIVYLPVAIGSLMLQIWSKWVFKKWAIVLGAYAVMAFLALLVTGFTSYIRYCYPLIVALPLILMKLDLECDK